MKMDKNDIVAKFAADFEVSQTVAKTTVDGVLGLIAAGLSKGEEVSLHGFGKFNVKSRPERQGRNPQNGEMVTVKASKSVGFKAAKALKDAL
jgi:DNA-binding protein HU-beta